MKIAVVAATGKAGRKIVAEATNRGFEVTAFVRRKGQVVDGAKHIVVKDIMNLTADDLKGFDAVVDAFGTFTPETLPLHTTTSQHLCDILSGSDTRLLIVGGAGSLYVDAEHKIQLFTTPEFPDAFKPLANAMANELDELRKRDDVNWTFVSPACDFQADGERTGKYLVGGEELIFNAAGESVISYADFAVAMVDEIASGTHIKQRIGVVKA
ncbi:MAG: NAD(P)-dependent oxidoreductase [Selenomonadaceae bacterium]|nr:NAD(P)-dependent oxidoreductase [Selenomonadaceae bacterium]